MIYRRILATLALALGLTYLTANPAMATGPDKVTGCAAYLWADNSKTVCPGPGKPHPHCADLGKPVTLVTIGVDPWGLDRDHDGHGCETPGTKPPTSKPTTAPTTKPTTAPTTSKPTTAPTTVPTVSPSTTRPPTTSPTPDDTATTNPTVSESPAATGSQLPLTGPPVWAAAGAGVLLVGLGGLALLARKRKTRFTA